MIVVDQQYKIAFPPISRLLYLLATLQYVKEKNILNTFNKIEIIEIVLRVSLTYICSILLFNVCL